MEGRSNSSGRVAGGNGVGAVTVSVDVVVLSVVGGELRCLVHRRPEAPYRGRWALPGVVVGVEESLDAAAARALADKGGGLRDVFLEQLYTFGAVRRDPRGRTISVAYYALAPEAAIARVAALDGVTVAPVEVDWSGEVGGPARLIGRDGGAMPLAFDHARVVGLAVQRTRGKLDYAAIGFELLPDRFPLRDLLRIHETILGRSLNKDSFRRRMTSGGLVEATGVRETGTSYRPAELYRFVAPAAASAGAAATGDTTKHGARKEG